MKDVKLQLNKIFDAINGMDYSPPVEDPYFAIECDTVEDCERLEYFLSLGLATDRAFKHLPYMGMVYGDVDDIEGCISSTEELLDWYEKQ